MSRSYGIWRTLGIAKTGDTSAIRAAYAKALKSFEVDDDPQRFTTLRDARDRALAEARRIQAGEPAREDDFDDLDDEDDEDDEDDSDAVFDPDSDAITDSEIFASSSGPDPRMTLDAPSLDTGDGAPEATITTEAADFAAAMDRRYNAVLALLFSQADESLSDADQAELIDHVTVLLADPRMVELVFHDEAERWFSTVLADAIPRSDILIPQLIDAFDWIKTRGRIDQPPAIERVVERYDSLAFWRAVQGLNHPLNGAWRELTKPAHEGSRRTFGVRSGPVRKLLTTIRRDHPDLEGALDWYRVSLWETDKASGGAGWRPISFGIFFLIMIIRIAASSTDTPQRPLQSPTITVDTMANLKALDTLKDEVNDTGVALESIGGAGFTLTDIRQRNPRLYTQLNVNWNLAKDEGRSRSKFIADTREMLIDRYTTGLRRADYDVTAQHSRLFLAKLAAMRSHGWDACDDFLGGKTTPPDWIGDDLRLREKALIQRVLLETDGDPKLSKGPTKFTVKASVIDEAARRAGLDRDLFVASLNDEGTPRSRCEARIGLAETALDLPLKDGLKLLRDM